MLRRTPEAAAYSDALNLGVEDFRKHWTFEQSPDCFDELGAELGLNSREIYRRLEEVTVEDFRDMVFDPGPRWHSCKRYACSSRTYRTTA